MTLLSLFLSRIMTFKAIVQLFVLGCSWGIGLFMVIELGKTVKLIIAYLFTIINVLQGVLIFVVHCLLNRQVSCLVSYQPNTKILLEPLLIFLVFHISIFKCSFVYDILKFFLDISHIVICIYSASKCTS